MSDFSGYRILSNIANKSRYRLKQRNKINKDKNNCVNNQINNFILEFHATQGQQENVLTEKYQKEHNNVDLR